MDLNSFSNNEIISNDVTNIWDQNWKGTKAWVKSVRLNDVLMITFQQ